MAVPQSAGDCTCVHMKMCKCALGCTCCLCRLNEHKMAVLQYRIHLKLKRVT